MVKGKNTGFRRLYNATRYTFFGFVSAWKNEEAFRQEIFILLILFPLGIWLGESASQRVILIGSWFIVIITELINSAIEAVVDRIGTEYHKLSGQAKDMASAAVFVSIIFVIMTWSVVLLDRFGIDFI